MILLLDLIANGYFRSRYFILTFPRRIRNWWQRSRDGWNDQSTWNVDHALAEFMVGVLGRFRKLSITRPPDMTEDRWDSILATIQYGFQRYIDEDERLLAIALDDNYGIRARGISKETDDALADSFELLKKYYRRLWW